MYKRTAYLAFSVVAAFGCMILTTQVAQSQGGGVKNLVFLQGASPGISQSGHSNISGNARAGQFIGGGGSLTGLNASNIASGTLADARLSTNVPLKNAANTFTATNIFNGFLGVGIGTGITTETLFRVHDATTPAGNYRGMYVSMANAGGFPFYGYSAGGDFDAWTYFDGGTNEWKLNTNLTDRMTVEKLTGKMGFNGPTGVDTYRFVADNAVTDGIRIVNDTTGNNAQLFLNGGNNFGTITQLGTGDILRIENDNLTLNISQNGHFGINTTAPTGAEDLTIQSTNTVGYGGVVVRSGDGTNGKPFYGYTTPNMYSWTYVDESDDQWKLYHNGDWLKVNLTGQFALGNFVTTANATVNTGTTGVNGSIDGIRSTVNGTSIPYAIWGSTIDSIGSGVGVRGSESSSSASAYGVFASGNSGASGTKSFMIDHPLDPTNKYLKHYSMEGPAPKNFYDGTVVTDSNGYAWVDLPDYFGEINIDARYQLTVIDESEDFVMAKVTKRIQNNRFQIRTSKPNVEVNWEVKATRNDRYVQVEGAPSEVEKPAIFKGTYQDPQLWGQPDYLGQDAKRDRVTREEMAKRPQPKSDEWKKQQAVRPPSKNSRDR